MVLLSDIENEIGNGLRERFDAGVTCETAEQLAAREIETVGDLVHVGMPRLSADAGFRCRPLFEVLMFLAEQDMFIAAYSGMCQQEDCSLEELRRLAADARRAFVEDASSQLFLTRAEWELNLCDDLHIRYRTVRRLSRELKWPLLGRIADYGLHNLRCSKTLHMTADEYDEIQTCLHEAGLYEKTTHMQNVIDDVFFAGTSPFNLDIAS